MVRPIIKDIFFLQQKSVPAGKADLPIAADLQDTLKAHRNECVGMAANMIGFQKNIIIVSLGLMDLVMQWHTQNFSGWPAQIIQHECDHLQGILI